MGKDNRQSVGERDRAQRLVCLVDILSRSLPRVRLGEVQVTAANEIHKARMCGRKQRSAFILSGPMRHERQKQVHLIAECGRASSLGYDFEEQVVPALDENDDIFDLSDNCGGYMIFIW